MQRKFFGIFWILIYSCFSAASQNKLPLTLESIWSGYFDEKNLQPHILNTKPAVAFIRAEKETNFEGILTLDMVTGKIIDTLFTNQTKVDENGSPTTFAFFEDFEFAPDDQKILIKTERQSMYHHSYKEFAYLWNNLKKTLKPVSTDGKISCAGFNKNGTYLSYIREANLYIRNLETDKTTAVTTDGEPGSIINGMADETYEDGFGLTKMYAWNPEGDRLAFIKINQGIVRKFPIVSYEKSEPAIKQYVYAKAGEAISEASLYIYDLKNNALTKLDLGGNPNQYITGFKWQPDGSHIFVERLNRAQKKLEILKCKSTNGSIVSTIFSEEKPDYIKIFPDNMLWNPKANSFYWLTEQDAYSNIHEINAETGANTQITKLKWDINSLDGFDSTTNTIYFTGGAENPTQRHLYMIKNTGKGFEKITDNRGWHTTWLSKDFKYFFDRSTTINTPSVYKIFRTNGSEVTNKAIIENKRFKETLQGYDINDAKMFSFKTKTNTELNGWIINGDQVEGIRKKPLLLYIYGGNNEQEVTEEWKDRMAMTFRFFANKGYTIACIDPSGTPGKGEQFRKRTYNSLTGFAIEDILETRNYLVRNYRIDESNTALMGWSYGGFLTALMATKYSGNFNKYVAISPVTNWRDYNAPFTERIIGNPSDNPVLYKELLPEEYISTYKGGLLLIHGSADDNVHVQHSMKLAKALTDSDAYYDLQIFTDKGHSLSDGDIDKTRMNLFRKIFKFLERPETNR
jgi:dipeptidyl-peptidase-4